jgi:hypothetical protein
MAAPRGDEMSQRAGGLIAYYELGSWWAERWTPEERGYIAWRWDSAPTVGAAPWALCSGASPRGITRVGPDHPGRLIGELGAMMIKADEFHIARRLFEDADRALPPDDWYNRHFLYSSAGHVCYRRRDDSDDGLALAVYYYSQQVAIEEKALGPVSEALGAVPSHRGFEQLTIIHAASAEYDQAIALAEQAREHGWIGDWDKRIARCSKARSRSS